MGSFLFALYLLVGITFALASAAFGKERLEGSPIASFIAAVFLWPCFLIEESCTGPARTTHRVDTEFRRLVQKYPDIAYRWMKNDPDAWLVIEPGSPEEEILKQLDRDRGDNPMLRGKFTLVVPQLGAKKVTIVERWNTDMPFASNPDTEDSKARFVERYGDRQEEG